MELKEDKMNDPEEIKEKFVFHEDRLDALNDTQNQLLKKYIELEKSIPELKAQLEDLKKKISSIEDNQKSNKSLDERLEKIESEQIDFRREFNNFQSEIRLAMMNNNLRVKHTLHKLKKK